ncbi:MAG TPA: aldolase/citrate lyase family protein [Burkholderiales bacterium]|nr:aldolase/citrate lyase family protein [Burkholderiales bacterium]
MRTKTLVGAMALIAGLGASHLALGQGTLPLTNKGGINPDSWVYGPRNDDTTGGLIWNPVKAEMMAGGDVIGRTMSSNDLATMNTRYCELASESNADFTWTEMQHSGIDWGDAWRMWAFASSTSCPNRRAIPGVRIAYTDEREIQHALDGGAMVLVVPTVDTVEEAKEVVQWAYFPPFGRRSAGGSQTAAVLRPWIPQGVNYRQTFNNNLVLIVMIETIEGVKNAEAIAKVPGIHGVFAASGDLGNFSGYQEGDADYEKLITEVHDATLAAGKRLCGPFRWIDRPGFTCFQN